MRRVPSTTRARPPRSARSTQATGSMCDKYTGELLAKQVTIGATIAMGDSSEERTMVVTLEKVVLGSGDDVIEGCWIISNIR